MKSINTLVEDVKKAGLFKNIWSIKRLEPSVAVLE